MDVHLTCLTRLFGLTSTVMGREAQRALSLVRESDSRGIVVVMVGVATRGLILADGDASPGERMVNTVDAQVITLNADANRTAAGELGDLPAGL